MVEDQITYTSQKHHTIRLYRMSMSRVTGSVCYRRTWVAIALCVQCLLDDVHVSADSEWGGLPNREFICSTKKIVKAV
jgi:hypothetical protein